MSKEHSTEFENIAGEKFVANAITNLRHEIKFLKADQELEGGFCLIFYATVNGVDKYLNPIKLKDKNVTEDAMAIFERFAVKAFEKAAV
jgi:hypothetical protein